MKYTYSGIKIWLSIIIVSTIVVASTTLKSQSIKILPIGNSITQLNNQHNSYRYELWKKLVDDGLDFDYVGSMTDHYNCGTPIFPDYNGKMFDKDHEGHWGWKTDEIINGGSASNCRGTGNISSWLNNYTPDIALIHLGTNDMMLDWNDGLGVAETINELKSLITILRADNPNVIILLAKLIPADPSVFSWAARIEVLNAEIPSIAIDMETEDSPIVIVDQFSGFSAIDDTFDGAHPNATGEEKMAQKWFDAIKSVLGNGFGLNIKTYLEGPYNQDGMNTSLLANIPLHQPFNVDPWNYQGTESIASLPSSNIVDWVLVELRDAPNVSSAGESTSIYRKAAFLLSDGSIVDLDGSSNLSFNISITHQLFVVIYHQNHLPVLSANALVQNMGIYGYDFTTATSKAFNNSQTDLGDSNFGMIAGDCNGDAIVDLNDISTIWNIQAGLKGYNRADMNLDSNVDNSDKNIFWDRNNGQSSILP